MVWCDLWEVCVAMEKRARERRRGIIMSNSIPVHHSECPFVQHSLRSCVARACPCAASPASLRCVSCCVVSSAA